MSSYRRSPITRGQLTARAQRAPKVSDGDILALMVARQYDELPMNTQKHDIIRLARQHARELPMPPRHMFIEERGR